MCQNSPDFEDKKFLKSPYLNNGFPHVTKIKQDSLKKLGTYSQIWQNYDDRQQVYITISFNKKTPNCDILRRATLDEGSRSPWSNELEQSYWSRAIN